jgi:hypothetical protein
MTSIQDDCAIYTSFVLVVYSIGERNIDSLSRILGMSITDIAPYTPILCASIGAMLTLIAALVAAE